MRQIKWCRLSSVSISVFSHQYVSCDRVSGIRGSLWTVITWSEIRTDTWWPIRIQHFHPTLDTLTSPAPAPLTPRLSLRWDPIGLVTTSIVSLTSCNGKKMLGENPVYIQSKIFLMLFILTYFNLSHLFLHENSNQPDDIWWDVLFSNVTLNHCVEIIYFCRIAIRTEYPTKWVSILLFPSK